MNIMGIIGQPVFQFFLIHLYSAWIARTNHGIEKVIVVNFFRSRRNAEIIVRIFTRLPSSNPLILAVSYIVAFARRINSLVGKKSDEALATIPLQVEVEVYGCKNYQKSRNPIITPIPNLF
jgi:hypothetical protein